ncbi:flagellum-specific ATP synthase FliI, partial [Proteus mirabilis]
MTARLGRWLEKLADAESRLNKIPRIRQYGRLTRATGLVMEAKGLVMPLGSTCLIERTIGKTVEEVESEVVGFNG